MLNAGKSDDDVRAYMVARYGNFILFRPPVSSKTIWLWATPGILLLFGAAIAVRITKQRAALLDQDNEPVEEDARSS
jgi:cytochrome c-type biogenesis protein CcmH